MTTGWDFAAISEQITRAGDADITLSASSLVLCLCALSQMEFFGQWGGIDDDEWDTIEAWLARAYLELITPIECEGVAAMEIGSVFVWPNSGATIPDTCLPCDGSEYLKATYPDLYTALGTDWESDATHFFVPDLRDRVVVGKGIAFGFGDTGGESEHTLTIDEMPAHNHDVYLSGSSALGTNSAARRDDQSYESSTMVQATGGDQPHNNMPPYLTLVWVIVAL